MNATLDALEAFGVALDAYRAGLVEAGAEMDAPSGSLTPSFAAPRATWLGQPLLDNWPDLFTAHTHMALAAQEHALHDLHTQVVDGLAKVFDAPAIHVSLDLFDGLYTHAFGLDDDTSIGLVHLATAEPIPGMETVYLTLAAQTSLMRARLEPLWGIAPSRGPTPYWHVLYVREEGKPIRRGPKRKVRAASWRDAVLLDTALHWTHPPYCARRVFDAHGTEVGMVDPET